MIQCPWCFLILWAFVIISIQKQIDVKKSNLTLTDSPPSYEMEITYWHSLECIDNFLYFVFVANTLLTKSWSTLVKIGRHWSKYVFGQGDSDDQYPKGPPLVTWLVLWISQMSKWDQFDQLG